MGVFGPKYPRPLQAVVTHAERLCACLDRLENGVVAHSDLGRAWLDGRTGEVKLVFELALADWESGAVSNDRATASLAAYLAELHAGARAHALGTGEDLECCDDDAFLTAPQGEDLETRLLPPPRDAVREQDTWFDPSAVVRDVYARPLASANTGRQNARVVATPQAARSPTPPGPDPAKRRAGAVPGAR